MKKPFRLFGGTVHAALVHAFTDYDSKQEARNVARRIPHSIYALGHYFKAVDNIDADIAAGATPREAILAATHGRLCDVALRAIGEPKATREEMTAQNGRMYYIPAKAQPAADDAEESLI